MKRLKTSQLRIFKIIKRLEIKSEDFRSFKFEQMNAGVQHCKTPSTKD